VPHRTPASGPSHFPSDGSRHLRTPFPAIATDPETAAALLPQVTLLDTRDEAAFARGHLPGSGRMTIEEFGERRAELPPRTAHVLVVHDEPEQARAGAEAVGALGYPHTRWLSSPLAVLAAAAGSALDTGPAVRLWRPSPFLERVLPRLPRGRSLDLAAGTSRESVFLAMHGREAEAWDHDDDALESARKLARRNGVGIRTHVIELESGAMPDAGGGWDIVMVFRFLHRPLFPWIESAVAPGGVLVYETFLTGQERFGSPKQKRFLLESGELRRAFPALAVEEYEEGAPDLFPVMARLFARRPI